MPKTTPMSTSKKTETKASKPSSSSASASTSKSKSDSSQPKLYSSFLPIPLILPSLLPIPCSSSSSSSSSFKPSTSVKHYIYARPHSNTKKSSSGELPEGRTLFVTNLPVDAGIQDLRGIFGKWGVVEDVKLAGVEVDALEQAVKGLPIDDSDNDESEDDDDVDDDDESDVEGNEEDENQVEEKEKEGKAEPQFQGDMPIKLTKNQRRSQRKKAKLSSFGNSIPTVIPLPSLEPRTTSFGNSGSRSGHIIYLDPISISRLMTCSSSSSSSKSVSVSPILLKNYPIGDKDGGEKLGLDYYNELYNTSRPSWNDIKLFADTSMEKFDYLHSSLLSSRAKKQGAGALVDEDGFTVVVRSGKYGRAGARGLDNGMGKGGVGVASRGFHKKLDVKKKGKGAGELPDFYKFQRNERKREELADLRSRFESDKQKVEELKKSRRFKPY
ncbi:uncharacterized protein IL334_005551 [Kwoniella shivajii]|uniref:RRM domain-containing protein n=1 Tax=Kwoniella shivajii TaxID=564305 RepID=A0ABZ1D3G5_9TREE|nr:hypothetical protein IL334_005551 [Kwoniella shivajii]